METTTTVNTTRIDSRADLEKYFATFFANGGSVKACAPFERSLAPGEAPLIDESFDEESN